MLDKKTKRKMDMCTDITVIITIVESFVGAVFASEALTIINVCYVMIISFLIILFTVFFGTIIGSSFDKEKRS